MNKFDSRLYIILYINYLDFCQLNIWVFSWKKAKNYYLISCIDSFKYKKIFMNKKVIATTVSALLIFWGLFFSGANAIQYTIQWNSTSVEGDFNSSIKINRWDNSSDDCENSCNHSYTNSWEYTITIDSESAQNITELRLRNSNITEIIDMEGGINIEELDLSYNHIENLWSNAFNWLNNIENLNLSNNKINNISKYAFSGSVIQNWKLMTYELHSAQVDPNDPYDRKYWVERVGNGIPCVRGQQTSSQICIDEANRRINLSNNELSNIPTFIENRENGSDSIEWTKLILADNATREYKYLVWNQFPTTWINVSRIINLKKNNLLSPVSVGSKDVAYNSPKHQSAPFSWVYITRNLYNSRNSNITSSYILTDPIWNIFTGSVSGILTWNEATEFGITPFHPKDGDDDHDTAHRINWNYTIDIKILSWDEVITTWTGTFDLEFVHAKILWEKLQSINNPKFTVSRSHQLAPIIHRTLSSTCQLIIDNEEHYCYPIDDFHLNTQISSQDDIDVIIDKNKISNDEWTGYIKIDILNLRNEPVVSDTLYFDYNNYTETNYTVNHYRQNVDGSSRSLADTETFTWIVDDIVTPSTKTYTGFTSPNTQSGTILSWGLLTINYYYTRNRYTVTYDSNGWTPIADTGILFEATIPTPTPSKNWFTFNGWSGLPTSGLMPANDIILTADWNANSWGGWWGNTETTYTVTITPYPTSYWSVSHTSVTANSGTTISTSWNTLTIGSSDVVASPNTPTTMLTSYSFSWWINNCWNSLTWNCEIVAEFKKNSQATWGTYTWTIFTWAERTWTTHSWTTRQYTVTITSSNTGYWTVSLESVTADFLSKISTSENILTIGSTDVIANPSDSTTLYTYSFSGRINNCWDTLTKTCSIIADFAKNTNQGNGNNSGTNWSSSSSSSNNWYSGKSHYTDEDKKNTNNNSISQESSTKTETKQTETSQTIQSQNSIKYISRSCKPYNIEYIPELNAYTSPDLKKKEYFVNIEYFKRYVDSKNAQNAECYVTNRSRITKSYIDTSNSNNRFVAPNWKIYFINQQNWFYRSSNINSSKNFTTIDELKNYIKKRNPLIPM